MQVIEQRDVLGKEFKIYGTPDEPLFLAKDVASWIEYEVLMQSRKPIAKKFKKKAKKILKDIRRHGMYVADRLLEDIPQNPDLGLTVIQFNSRLEVVDAHEAQA